jgi:hypothetical protein
MLVAGLLRLEGGWTNCAPLLMQKLKSSLESSSAGSEAAGKLELNPPHPPDVCANNARPVILQYSLVLLYEWRLQLFWILL